MLDTLIQADKTLALEKANHPMLTIPGHQIFTDFSD